MTPAEQIAYLRRTVNADCPGTGLADAVLAVCDIAARALLTDDEAEAVRYWLDERRPYKTELVAAVLPRLLPDERVEHRSEAHALDYTSVDFGGWSALCICGKDLTGDTLDAAVRAWAAHAGIGGTDQ